MWKEVLYEKSKGRKRDSLGREPLGVGPGLHNSLCVGVALLGQGLDIVKSIKHEEGVGKLRGSDFAEGIVLESLDERGDVVSTL